MAITLFDIRVYVRPELSVIVLAFKFSEKYIELKCTFKRKSTYNSNTY